MAAPSTHAQAYAKAVAAKRHQLWVGLLLLGVCVLLSGRVAEVSFTKFFDNIGSFTSYISRISHLESGQWVLSDPAEWFWGWKKWLALMGETLLMAYVGTVLGAAGALVLCFLPART
jgi:phosphonate transport system permease protein